jgi:hypothetical protein
MSVLPYRARRFIRHNLSWSNIRFQWAVIAATALILLWIASYEGDLFEAPWYSFSYRIMLAFVFVQFSHAAWKMPLPMDEPYLVKKYGNLKHWWNKASEPARIGMFEGKNVLERWEVCDFRSIYDHNGYLVATEQTINWSDNDSDWQPGDQDNIQTIITRHDGTERLSLIARLRSPKLPFGKSADIIRDGEVIGQTTYSEC